MSYNLSVQGSILSFLAGSSLITGFYLLGVVAKSDNGYYVLAKSGHEKDLFKMLSLNFIGGGLISFGLYVLVPNQVRALWYI